MIDRLIRAALSNRLLVVLFALGVIGGGAYSLRRLAIDAFPDVTPVLAEVITLSEGLAPQEVEQLVTYPIESAMNGLPDVQRVQSLSIFGLSDVKVYFADGVDIYFARQLVRAQLQAAEEQIPPDAGEPELAPISTALGQVYQYVLRGPAYDITELRTIEDWIV
ncbi:MAG TPA: efflux RND transporter permease subunit, partial [Actinomycetota bacterium]|nr:efflux RND transporter permease subunit [Actinomycetota bacterium]